MAKARARPGDDPPHLSSRHRRTLEAVFERPLRPDIPWRDIENLFVALGGEVSEGRGSRVRVALNGERAVFHEPHPERVTDRGAIKDVREFLERAGVRP
jgi:hypothetical protein